MFPTHRCESPVLLQVWAHLAFFGGGSLEPFCCPALWVCRLPHCSIHTLKLMSEAMLKAYNCFFLHHHSGSDFNILANDSTVTGQYLSGAFIYHLLY